MKLPRWLTGGPKEGGGEEKESAPDERPGAKQRREVSPAELQQARAELSEIGTRLNDVQRDASRIFDRLNRLTAGDGPFDTELREMSELGRSASGIHYEVLQAMRAAGLQEDSAAKQLLDRANLVMRWQRGVEAAQAAWSSYQLSVRNVESGEMEMRGDFDTRTRTRSHVESDLGQGRRSLREVMREAMGE
ncbi:hypothetical protein HY635_00120 [Candidatus Uhrbacteria bacterium]|nr:hypothetical protein [Candidatus Uhrbacteria bacterium]